MRYLNHAQYCLTKKHSPWNLLNRDSFLLSDNTYLLVVINLYKKKGCCYGWIKKR